LHTAEPVLDPIADGDFLADVGALADSVAHGGWSPDFIIGIGRGGLVPAVYLSHRLDVPMLSIDQSSRLPDFADALLGKVAAKTVAGTKLLVVDDINDSGATIATIRELLAANGGDAANLRFAVLLDNVRSSARVDYRARTIDRHDDKRWFVFPWEAVGATATIVADARAVPGRLA